MDENEKLLIEYRILIMEQISKRFKKYSELEKGNLLKNIKLKEDEILSRMKTL